MRSVVSAQSMRMYRIVSCKKSIDTYKDFNLHAKAIHSLYVPRNQPLFIIVLENIIKAQLVFLPYSYFYSSWLAFCK